MTQYEFYLLLAAIVGLFIFICFGLYIVAKSNVNSNYGDYEKFVPRQNEYTYKSKIEYYKPDVGKTNDQNKSKTQPTPTQETKN